MSISITRSASVISGTTTVAGRIIDRFGRTLGYVAHRDTGRPAPKPAPTAEAEAVKAVVATIEAVTAASAPITTTRKERKPGGGGGKSYADIKSNNKITGDKTGKEVWNTGTSKKSRSKGQNRRRISCFTANRQDRITRTNHSGFSGKHTRKGCGAEAEPLTFGDSVALYAAYDRMFDGIPLPTSTSTTWDTLRGDICSRATAARKAERRRVNRTAFTLSAVLRLIATRKGTARKRAGGVGFTAYGACTNVATLAAVATAIAAVVRSVGAHRKPTSSSTSASNSMNVNQSLARTQRVKRQRRNGVVRRNHLKPQTKSGYEKQQAKAARRAEAKRLAARLASEKVSRYAVTTKAAASAALQAGNNPVWLASGAPTPTLKAVAKRQRALLQAEFDALPPAIQNRRLSAEGLLGRRRSKPAAPVLKSQEDLAQEAYVAGQELMAEILNGSESEVTSIPAVDITAATAAKYPAAEGMTMAFNRRGTQRPTRRPASTSGRSAKRSSTETKNKETKKTRFEVIAELWKPIDARDLTLEQKLNALTRAYPGEAKRSTVEGYLAQASAQGLVDTSAHLDVTLAADYFALTATGMSAADTYSELGVTAFEVSISIANAKPAEKPTTPKEETVRNTTPRGHKPADTTPRGRGSVKQQGSAKPKKQMDIEIGSPIRFTADLATLGCTPAFTLRHTDAMPVNYDTDAIAIAVSRVNTEVCNANAHFSPLPRIKNKQAKYEDFYFAADAFELNVPTAAFLGFDYKGEKQGWSASPIGVVPTRLFAERMNVVSPSQEWADAFYTNVANLSYSSYISHHINFESLVNGKHDLYDRVEGRAEVGSTAATVRNLLRQAAYTGDTKWITQLEAHGQTIEVYNALEGLMAEDTGVVDPRTDEVVGDHYLLVVARVNKIHDDTRKGERNDAGQYRHYSDNMVVYFVPADVAHTLFDLEDPRKDNNWFTFLEKEATTPTRGARSSANERRVKSVAERRGARTAPAPTSAPIPAPEGRNKPAAQVEKRTRRTERNTPAPSSTPERSNLETKEVAQTLLSFKEELEALYDASMRPTTDNRAQDFYTADEVIAMFGLEGDSYREAFEIMFPAADAPSLDAFISGDKKKVSLAKKVAYAISFYLRGFLTEADPEVACALNDMPVLDHDWRYSEVEGMVQIFQELFALANASTAKGRRAKRARKAEDILCLKEVNGAKAMLMDGEVAFTFGDDGIVYDWRGRAFSNCLFVKADKKPQANPKAPAEYDTDVKIVSSMGMFVYFMWLVWLPTISNWSGKAGLFSNTLANVKSAGNKLGTIFKWTSDKVQNQNGAAQHMLINCLTPFMYADRSPVDMGSKGKHAGIAVWPGLGAAPAKALGERYLGTGDEIDPEFDFVEAAVKKEISIADVLEQVMHQAHAKYGIDLHYTKGQFVAGVLGHINLDMVEEYAPNLYATLCNYLELSETAYMVIANTIKAAKGLKRISLSLAQAEEVANAVLAAWKLYGMENYSYGWLNHAGYAPVHVGPPGMSLFLGAQSDKPEANPKKKGRVERKDVVIDKKGKKIEHPFDYSRSNVDGVCEAEWATVDGGDGWFYTTPDSDIFVKGTRKEILFGVHGAEPVRHERYLQGQFVGFKWQYSVSMDNKTEILVVEYEVKTSEFDMKSRQVNKSQYATVDPMALYNHLNGDLTPADCKVIGLHLQDGMKMDALYSWLFIVANTAFHNDVVTPVIAKFRKMIAENNVVLTGDENLVNGKPAMIIEATAVAAGLYDPLLKLFHETFAQVRWLLWADAGVMGRMMHLLYSNKVAAGKWHEVKNPLAVMPELADIQGNLVVYSEHKEITDTTSVLAFGLDENGEVIEYAQRGVMYLSTAEAQVYNVELFESSTVKEAVSSSDQLMTYIKALSLVAGKTKEVFAQQRFFLEEGREAVYRAKTLHAGLKGDTLNPNLMVLDIIIDEQGVGGFSTDARTTEAIEVLEANLTAANVDLGAVDVYRDKLFTIFAEASRDIVFRFVSGTETITLWLPALLSFTKLSSTSDEHRDFVSMFFYEVLIPCVELKDTVNQVSLNQIVGMMSALFHGRMTRRFMSGSTCATAKRICLPNIPVGEVWVLISDDTNSVYREMARDGIPVDDLVKVAAGIVVMSTRAPMPMGPVLRVRLVEEVWEDVTDGEGNTISVYKGQRLVPFDGETQSNELLFYEMSPVQMGIDAMSVNLDGGDFDGDGNFLTLLKFLGLKHITTFDQIRSLRSAAIGLDMFDVECDGYAADHYNIKSFKKATVTLLDLRGAIVKDALKQASVYIDYNYTAFQVQHVGVGVMYAAYAYAEILCEMVRDMHRMGMDEMIPADLRIFLGDGLEAMVLILAEVYEIMLGGYSEGAARLWCGFLKRVMLGESFISKEEENDVKAHASAEIYLQEKLTCILKDMGANHSRSAEFLVALNQMREYYTIKKGKEPCPSSIHNLAYVVIETGRGKFKEAEQQVAYNLAHCFYTEVKKHPQGTQLINENMSLYGFKVLDEVLGLEYSNMKYVAQLWEQHDLDFFLNGLRTVEQAEVNASNSLIHNLFVESTEEDDDEDEEEDIDGGNNNNNTPPTPPTPPTPSDDGGAEESIEENDMTKRTMQVVNIKTGGTGHYIGRPGRGKKGSALANEAVVGKDGTREECYEAYREWLWEKVQAQDAGVVGELQLLRETRPDLVCFCAPKQCHGELIIEMIDHLDSLEEIEGESKQDNPLVVISGSRSVSELPDEALDTIDEFIARGASFNVGDAPGVDSQVQQYLQEQGCDDVQVWFSLNKGLRTCLSGFAKKGVKGSYTQRDEAMHRNCDESLVVWDGSSAGSRKNIGRVENTTVINLAEIAAAKARAEAEALAAAEAKAEAARVAAEEGELQDEIYFNSKTPEYAWLSNFHDVEMEYKGYSFCNSESAYQWAKSGTAEDADKLAVVSGGTAYKLGKTLKMRKDWDEVKVDVMAEVLEAKFLNEDLALKLMATGNAELVHFSPWDTYWGVNNKGRGQNLQGKLLMDLRKELRDNPATDIYVEESLELNSADNVVDPEVLAAEKALADAQALLEAAAKAKEEAQARATAKAEAARIAAEAETARLAEVARIEAERVVFEAETSDFTEEAREEVRKELESCISDGGVKDPDLHWLTQKSLAWVEAILSDERMPAEYQAEVAAELHELLGVTAPAPAPQPTDEQSDLNGLMTLSYKEIQAKAKECRAMGLHIPSLNAKKAVLAQSVIDALCAAPAVEITTPVDSAVVVETVSPETENSASTSFDDETEEYVPEMPIEDEIEDVPTARKLESEPTSAPSRRTRKTVVVPAVEEVDEENALPEMPCEDEEDGFQFDAGEDELEVIPVAKNLNLSNTAASAPVAVTKKEPTAKPVPVVKTEPKAKKKIPSIAKLRKQVAHKKQLMTQQTLDAVHSLLQDLPRNVDVSAYEKEVATLSGSQLLALQKVMAGDNVVLTGVGGGGKSYTTEIIRHVYNAFKFPYVVVGSTGTSVMNVEGDGTFNSVFGLKTGFEDSDDGRISQYADFCKLVNLCRDSRFLTNAKLYKEARPILIVLDEVSMVDNRLLHVVLKAIEDEKANVQWLLVGDPMQFMPVSGDLFFEAMALSDDQRKVRIKEDNFLTRLDFVEVNLAENIRASGDVAWVDCLNDMRLDRLHMGAATDNIVRDRFEFSKTNDAPADAIHLFFNNAGVKMHNRRGTEKMIAEGAESKVYRAKAQSKYGEGWFKRSKNDGQRRETVTIFDPIEEAMTFCVGMPVMIRKNITAYTGELLAANGSRGIVTTLGKTSITVCIESTGQNVVVEATNLPCNKDRNGNPIGVFNQIPAHPCFAMTFHKAQGLTIDCPGVIHAYFLSNGRVECISPKFCNSLYVAFSRFTKSEHVYIATSSEFNTKLTPDQMWNLLVGSYHTGEQGLGWVESIR